MHTSTSPASSSASTLSESDAVEIRLSGSGGQGIQLAATLLAEAGLAGGRRVVQTQSYGPEARGGASKAEVIIARREIHYPEVRWPDITVCLSQAAFDKYADQACPGSCIYVDSGLVQPSSLKEVTLLGAPFTAIAISKLGKSVVTNIVMLGALAARSGVVSLDDLAGALGRRLPERLLELNRKALAVGATIELAGTS